MNRVCILISVVPHLLCPAFLYSGQIQRMVSGINTGFEGSNAIFSGEDSDNDLNTDFIGDLNEIDCHVIRYHQYGAVMVEISGVDSWTSDVENGYMEVVKISNQSNTDPWICIPSLVASETVESWGSNAYLEKLASLLKKHLNADRKVYVEYSNEVWNAMYSEGGGWDEPGYNGQYSVVRDRGKAIGFGGTDDNERDDRAGTYYTVFAATECWKILEDSLGDERVINVLAGWQWNGLDSADVSAIWMRGENWATNGMLLEALEGANTNPGNAKMEAFATNPYFHEFSASSGEGVAGVITACRTGRKILNEQGYSDVLYVAYEGGQHLVGENSYDQNTNPKMYDLYTQWLEGLEPYLDVNVHYRFAIDGNTGGHENFYIKAHTGDDLSLITSLKARALHDYYTTRDVSAIRDLDTKTQVPFSPVITSGLISFLVPPCTNYQWSVTALNGAVIRGFSVTECATGKGLRIELRNKALSQGTYVVRMIVDGNEVVKSGAILK